MTLQAKLDAFKADFVSGKPPYNAPPQVHAVMKRATDELIASGDQKNGFVQVDSANFSGWVQKTLVGPSH